MIIKPHERRYKRLRLTIRETLSIFVHDPVDFVQVNKIKLPKDVHPIDVYFDNMCGCFYFLLESEEFDPVRDGDEIEVIDSTSEIIQIPRILLTED